MGGLTSFSSELSVEWREWQSTGQTRSSGDVECSKMGHPKTALSPASLLSVHGSSSQGRDRGEEEVG